MPKFVKSPIFIFLMFFNIPFLRLFSILELFFHFLNFTIFSFFSLKMFLSFFQFVHFSILSIVSILGILSVLYNKQIVSEVTNFLCTKIKIFGLLRKGFSQQNVAWLCCICVQHSFNPSFDHKKDIRGLLSSSFSCIQFSTTSRENHLEFLEKLDFL